MSAVAESLKLVEERIERTRPIRRVGRVVEVTGLLIHSEGPEVSLGEICEVSSSRHQISIAAEVVGFRENRVLMMPFGGLADIHPGCQVTVEPRKSAVPVGVGLLGRTIDGLGCPLDDLGPLKVEFREGMGADAPNPMKRRPINQGFQTGVKAIDLFAPVGRGQRMGIFSASGVGKSSLLGMMTRGSEADVNVIALVGERGRELRDFIETDLGHEGMARSVVVVSTSDQPAPLRVRAANLATTIAEAFREEGKSVLFLMDSLTRFAMAQREIGLSVGEPPTSRGYTPSVFSALPRLLERTGTSERGSITAIYTILVEGDDMNEPVADAVRGILDGHIVLSRALASANHYPPIDVLESVSRLGLKIYTPEEGELISRARDLLSVYRKNEDLINIGAYAGGTSSKIDEAIAIYDRLNEFLKQDFQVTVPRSESFEGMKEIFE